MRMLHNCYAGYKKNSKSPDRMVLQRTPSIQTTSTTLVQKMFMIITDRSPYAEMVQDWLEWSNASEGDQTVTAKISSLQLADQG